LLSISGHGYGWKGACIDQTNNGSVFSINGFQKTLKDAGRVDIICFKTCSMVEKLFIFRTAYE